MKHVAGKFEQTSFLILEPEVREVYKSPAPRPGLRTQKKAVWVVHGMGQQIRFQTLDQVTQGLQRAEAEARGVPVGQLPPPDVRVVKIGDQILRRLELRMRGRRNKKGDEPEHEVHLYEAYWAPKTEGAVTLRDVMGFLFRAGVNGLRKSRIFLRWMFNRQIPFRTRKTRRYLLVALSVVASLVMMNAVILAVVAARAPFASPPQWLSQELFWDLTAAASIFCAFAISFGVILLLAARMKNSRERWRLPGALRRAMNFFFGLVLVFTVLVAAGMMLLVYAHRQVSGVAFLRGLQGGVPALRTITLFSVIVGILALFVRANPQSAVSRRTISFLFFVSLILPVLALFLIAFPSLGSAVLPNWMLLRSGFWVWPLLIGVTVVVRTLLVQYVGDVAAYVASHTLDRFDELREKIKESVQKTAEAVYLALSPAGTDFEYCSVAVVGHSLGSVVAYDTLNHLINTDQISGNHLQIPDRTCLFLTFGSPLDKTAFLFSVQSKGTHEAREVLAAAVQPMIQNYRFRPFLWVNVYSANDMISGPVDFYDDPLSPAYRKRGIKNRVDLDASIPLLAHIEYWENRKVWRRLYHELMK